MVTAKDAAQAFLKEVWKLYRLPKSIVLERDMKWTSDFWEGPCNQIGIRKKMCPSFYFQTDGKIERVNQTLETYL
jgi:hypothetical protein